MRSSVVLGIGGIWRCEHNHQISAGASQCLVAGRLREHQLFHGGANARLCIRTGELDGLANHRVYGQLDCANQSWLGALGLHVVHRALPVVVDGAAGALESLAEILHLVAQNSFDPLDRLDFALDELFTLVLYVVLFWVDRLGSISGDARVGGWLGGRVS